ncbi:MULTISPECIES: HAD-IA family hydrolase [Kitasatospora]|uniref:Putative phosphatase n=1 Tax=Kitasatospora setae (strain ATCC 33774 / DSM 43861 / JCM 3304 / KCC A-0304 / NBRC 14216 / KM-6054) TaxID=452652 RepID=E4N4J0_KITSK|nr:MULTISPECIES: HAD-IA family hydrolase [Kitasatospora]BAJ26121.1 putative phosphatase [Kitasatospora setae KM-6054]
MTTLSSAPEPVGLVIFDCDGVLVDIERIAVRVQVETGAELGWPLDVAEVVERFIGRPPAAIRQQIEERLGTEAAAEWERRFERRHRELVDAELTAVDGIVDALDGLDARGLPYCVASSGSHDKMRHTLGRTGLYERLAGRIFSASEVARGKPFPDVFLHAAARMGYRPEVCVVVEDSPAGLRAARAAGMRRLGYTAGPTGPALAEREFADQADTVLFSDMRRLPELLD